MDTTSTQNTGPLPAERDCSRGGLAAGMVNWVMVPFTRRTWGGLWTLWTLSQATVSLIRQA